MSESDDAGDSMLPDSMRTVTPPSGTHPDAEMDTIGWAMLFGLLVILTPLIPILAAVWLISKIRESLQPS